MGILVVRRVELREKGHADAVAQARVVSDGGRVETQLVIRIDRTPEVLHTRFWVGENLRGALHHAMEYVMAKRSLR